jgi:hypothetical protein
VKIPKAVVNVFVKVEPRVVGVGLVREIVVPLLKPVLSVIMVVTSSGAPDVIEVAVVTSPVLAVRVPNGTKLNWVEIVTAFAGAFSAAIAIPEARATANQLLFMVYSLKR